MTFGTETKLKSYLDTNQLSRERLCLAILSQDKRFSDVRPRHPHGGPDGGIDIDATFKNGQIVACAVGFVVGANDSNEHKQRVNAKFESDAKAARSASPASAIFVFFSNVDLTIGEEAALKSKAAALGFSDCEIFDRERMRVALDSVDGFAARFQYLDIPLSEAEQASFFGRWGDDIQSVISTGFQRVEGTLNRLMFLQEAEEVLGTLTMYYELDRTYDADEIGHYRAFCYLHLVEPKHRIFSIFFGSTDGSQRFFGQDRNPEKKLSGIRHGIGGAQWEEVVKWDPESVLQELRGESSTKLDDLVPDEDEETKWTPAGNYGRAGLSEVRGVSAEYRHDGGFIRYLPRFRLRDIDGAMFIHYMNASLAKRVKTVHVFANGYKLAEFGPSMISIDPSTFDNELPPTFSHQELADPWIRIRGGVASMHTLDFSSNTPKRMFQSKETSDSLPRTKTD